MGFRLGFGPKLAQTWPRKLGSGTGDTLAQPGSRLVDGPQRSNLAICPRACFAGGSSDKVAMPGAKRHNLHKARTVHEVEQAKKRTNDF